MSEDDVGEEELVHRGEKKIGSFGLRVRVGPPLVKWWVKPSARRWTLSVVTRIKECSDDSTVWWCGARWILPRKGRRFCYTERCGKGTFLPIDRVQPQSSSRIRLATTFMNCHRNRRHERLSRTRVFVMAHG